MERMLKVEVTIAKKVRGPMFSTANYISNCFLDSKMQIILIEIVKLFFQLKEIKGKICLLHIAWYTRRLSLYCEKNLMKTRNLKLKKSELIYRLLQYFICSFIVCWCENILGVV